MLVIGHRRFLPSLEKKKQYFFLSAWIYFSCFIDSRFFFEILCYFLETLFGNITPSQAKLTGQMSTSSPTSPHPHFHHPFYTPVLIMCFSRAPGIVCYPIIIYIGCEKGKCYPFILLETPPKMGYPLPACAKEQGSLIVNFKKSLARTFVVFLF